MKNKNKILGITIGITLLLSLMIVGFVQVRAVEVLGNGDMVLTSTEFASLSDEQIANYMYDEFEISNIKIHEDKIEIVYNLIYVEPTHVNNTYKVFNYGYQTYVSYDLLQECLSLVNMNTCVGLLVTNTEAYTYEIENNETRTIIPTYVTALNQGVRKYQQTIELRNSISKRTTMEEFISNLE